MSKYINADDFKKKLRERYKAGIIGRKVLICEFKAINEMPAADVVEAKYGEWIRQEYYCVCSNCRKYYIPIDDKYDFNFCPRCGAVMRGK